jgi:hypothetical protein
LTVASCASIGDGSIITISYFAEQPGQVNGIDPNALMTCRLLAEPSIEIGVAALGNTESAKAAAQWREHQDMVPFRQRRCQYNVRIFAIECIPIDGSKNTCRYRCFPYHRLTVCG